MLSCLERCHKESFGWAMICCRRDAAEAENVLQSVYLKVLEGKAVFDGRSELKTWLFSVIRRTAAEMRRREFWHGQRLLRFFQHSAALGSAGTVDETIYRSEIHKLFEQALVRLSTRQRQVLQLILYNEMTLADAAIVMNVSVGSARVHYDRAKKRLREVIHKEGRFDEAEFGRKRDQRTVSHNPARG